MKKKLLAYWTLDWPEEMNNVFHTEVIIIGQGRRTDSFPREY